jgi:hypothetical protein
MRRRTGAHVRRLTAVFLLLVAAGFTVAETRNFSVIDQAVERMGRGESIGQVVAFVGQRAGSDWERARGAYTWMTRNIAYDADAYFRGTRAVVEAEAVFKKGKSVCQGYAELFAALARGLGLEAVVIPGYAKGYAYAPGQRFTETNHAWNAVMLDGQWHFMETTWGAGYVDGTRFVPHATAAWFDTDPRLFVLHHFPEDPRWLLVGAPMKLSEYEKAPFVETWTLRSLLEAGFDPQELLPLLACAPLPKNFGSYAMSFKLMGGSAADLAGYLAEGVVPEAYSYPGANPELVDFPRQGLLSAGTRYHFAFRLPGCEQAAVISGGAFTFLQRDNDVFSGDAVAAPGSLRMSAKLTFQGKSSFWPLMIWRAKESGP